MKTFGSRIPMIISYNERTSLPYCSLEVVRVTGTQPLYVHVARYERTTPGAKV